MKEEKKPNNKILETFLKYIQKFFFHSLPDSGKEKQPNVFNAEEKLKTTELEFRSLMEQASDGIFISDGIGKYVDVNLSGCKMLGYTKEELLCLNVNDIVVREGEGVINDPPKLDDLLAGKTILTTRNLRRKDGSSVPVEINARMLSNGKLMGMVRDITERKKAEEKLVDNEKQFRHTLDNMLEGIQIHDFDWRYTYVNDALVKYSTYSREELMGYTLMEKYPGIEQSPLFKVLERCMIQRVTEHLETEFIFPNGTKAFFELSIQPVPQGIFILSIDITDRKKAEANVQKLNEELEQKVMERTAELERNVQQLKESEEKFQKAFQASAAGITITRRSDSKYLDVNDAFAQMTGFTKEELIGHSSAELGIVVNMKKRDEILQLVREYGSARNFELTVRDKSGRILEILSSVETILLGGEQFLINIIYDITERKRSEEQLDTLNKELEAFTYSVSHDLRAPLRAVNGYAKMLEEDYEKIFDDEAKRLLNVIQHNATKMSDLIDDLLAFSRLGKKAVQKTDLNMKGLIKRIVMDFNNTIKHKAEIKIGDLHPIQGDYALLQQVFVNLLSNAIKYSSKKDNPVVEVNSEEKDGEVIFTVKDNGVGFDMAYANKLFGVFQRLHKEEEFEGTGVGLAIVQKIISKHEGRIWVDAAPGKGATFSIALPEKEISK
jgi:PAS domain S-box-containing protein